MVRALAPRIHAPKVANPMHFTKVGLTGGIAAGKSSVAELWRTRGATIIDSDSLAHATLAPGTPTYRQVVAEFGPDIVNPDGTINRRTLGEIVFNDAARRQKLNNIIHPVVRQQWTQALAETSGVRVVVIPLLFEIGAEAEFDTVVVVGCSAPTQLARLTAKGLTEAQAGARIRSQWPMQQKMDRGNFVIWNDGSRAVLDRQAELIWNKLKEN
ncbi:MAG: Dephospho-CoA kinase [Verrucomicrobiae bacterium]|nr:Dephospho-CoA kinase [Verrucomicrobiae bacterium]